MLVENKYLNFVFYLSVFIFACSLIITIPCCFYVVSQDTLISLELDREHQRFHREYGFNVACSYCTKEVLKQRYSCDHHGNGGALVAGAAAGYLASRVTRR